MLADLRAESAALDERVADLPDADWARATPAEGWTIAHQIAHLAWTDEVAHLAVTDPDAFQQALRQAAADPFGFVDAAAARRRRGPHRPTCSTGWRAGRDRLADALAAVPDGQRIAWFGPPMSAASMATARLMETWAHGLDVADALGRRRRADRPVAPRGAHRRPDARFRLI